MNLAANVHSLETLRDWHAALCIYRDEAMVALSSIAMEIQRADGWLEEMLHGWQREQREAEEEILRCKAELNARNVPDATGRIPDCSQQEEALWRAERKLEYIHHQIEVVRRWFVKLPKMVSEAYEGPSRHLMNFLEAELPRGIAMLGSQITALDAYLNIRPEETPAAPAPPTQKE